MTELFIKESIVAIFVQICLVINFKQNRDSKSRTLFFGIAVSNLISIILAYVFEIKDMVDLGCEIVFLFFVFCNCIVFSIGLAINLDLHDKTINLNKTAVIAGMIVLLFNVTTFVIIPAVNEKIMSQKIIKYFNNEYGDNDFEIVSIKKYYSYNGFVSKYHIGYELKMSTSLMKDNFSIYFYETNAFGLILKNEEEVGKYIRISK